jgi:DNA (cytosine-5)-methyltransferase 1
MKSSVANLELPFGANRTKSESKIQGKNLSVVGLFAGIGGVERGLGRSGHEALLFCEIDQPAQAVLRSRFKNVPIVDDVRKMVSLPRSVDLLTGGFPCQDLSQAGKAEGILKGKNSSLVTEIFRLVQKTSVPNVLLENVPFMLRLDGGRAMSVLAEAFEKLGYKWAYRVVNSMSFGVPQRRERVLFLASAEIDPRTVLFADEAHPLEKKVNSVGSVACGFYWTEGIRGLGWAVNGVPTLKGGSTIGIPSPPAIVFPDGLVGTPDIRDAERMQGFPAGWTKPASTVARESHRWKLVGNAVTVGVFSWVGKRLKSPTTRGMDVAGWAKKDSEPWADAGWNIGSGRYSASLTRFPLQEKEIDLVDWLRYPVKPLSERATAGFLARAKKGSLNFPDRFIVTLEKHLSKMRKEAPDSR